MSTATTDGPKLIPAKMESRCWVCREAIAKGASIMWHGNAFRDARGRMRSPVWHATCTTPDVTTYQALCAKLGDAVHEHAAQPVQVEAPYAEPQPAAQQPSTEQTAAVEAKPASKPRAPAKAGADGGPWAQMADALLPHLEGRLSPAPCTDKPALDVEAVRALVASELAKLDTRRIPVEVRLPEGQRVDCKGEHVQFARLVQLLGLGERVFIGGPMGSGKTTGVERAAAALGIELFIQPPVNDPTELLGYRDAHGTYHSTPLYRWTTCEKRALLLLDEVDRSAPRALLAINAALANGFAVFPHEQRTIPQGHMVAATANTWGTGAHLDYVGATKLDAATVDRFTARLSWDYDEELERKLSEQAGGSTHGARACKVASTVRKNARDCGIRFVWGPRSTVALARRLASGMSEKDALAVSSLATVADDQRAKLAAGV